MAIATYSALQTSVANWLKRTDLTSVIQDAITLAESRIARELRIRKQISTATLSTTADTRGITLPTDFLEAENVSLATDPKTQLVYVNIEHLDAKYPEEQFTGSPAVYTFEADEILFGPTPDGVYDVTLLYYARLAALSDTNTTNWLLTYHPDVYLFCTLAEMNAYILNDERVPLWEQKARASIAAVQAADDAGMFSGTALRVRRI